MTSLRRMTVGGHLYIRHIGMIIALLGHLPEVPSTKEVAANGLSLGASQGLLLK